MSIRIAVVVVAIAACHAPADPLARFRAAHGGSQWASVHGVETTASISIGGLTGTSETIEDVATGRHRTHVKVGSLELGDGYDGTAGWEIAVGGEVVSADTPEAKALAVTSAWLTRRGFLSPAGARYVDRGDRADASRHFHVVEATPDRGAAVELWFDDATGYLARTRDQDGANMVVTYYDDYRMVDGLAFPYAVVVDNGDPRNQVRMTVAAIHLRPEVADAEFARPDTDSDRITLAEPTVEIPFELINNHIYIHAAVDGKPVRLLVDTGGLNLLTPAAVARLGLEASGKLAATGTGDDKVDVGLTHATTLQLGGVTLAKPVFYVIDMGVLADVEGESFDGLVGFELFHRLVVRIDYAGGKLALRRRDGFTPPAQAIAVPFELREHIPIVAGEIDGMPARLTIDTGARNSLTATSPYVRAHELEKRYQPKFETITGWGVGGGSRAKPVRFKRVKLGAAAVDDVSGELFTGDKGSFAEPDSAGNIGSGLLKRFVVTFDYADHVMYLEPGPTLPKDVYDRAGMFYLAAGDALEVAAITPGGPAEAAGLHVDDRIVTIDGQPIATKRLYAWREVLSTGMVGAKHVLGLASGAKHTLVLAELLP